MFQELIDFLTKHNFSFEVVKEEIIIPCEADMVQEVIFGKLTQDGFNEDNSGIWTTEALIHINKKGSMLIELPDYREEG